MNDFSQYDKASYYHAAKSTTNIPAPGLGDLISNWPDIPAKGFKAVDYWCVVVNGNEVYKASKSSCVTFLLVNEGKLARVTMSAETAELEYSAQRERNNQQY